MIGPLLVLSGCHVFESISIDCYDGMPCAGTVDTDEDTWVVDTGALVASSRGWVVSITGNAGNRVQVYAADGTLLQQWTVDASGPVAYDPTTGQGVLLGDDTVYWLGSDASVQSASLAGLALEQVEIYAGVVYAATADNVFAADYGGASGSSAFDAGLESVGAIGLTSDGAAVWVTRVGDGGPDLYRYARGAAAETITTSFETDGTSARARVVFAGRDGEAHTCSSAGTVHRVADLDAGTREPIAWYDLEGGVVTDVSKCAYDAGDDTWLVLSPEHGIYRFDEEGRGERVDALADGFTLVAGNFH